MMQMLRPVICHIGEGRQQSLEGEPKLNRQRPSGASISDDDANLRVI